MSSVRSVIVGVGSYLPEKVLTNQDLEKMMDTTDEWIRERTGIKRRHLAADDETDPRVVASGRNEVLDVLFRSEPTQNLRRQARLFGMKTLVEDAADKALEGVTTLAEAHTLKSGSE